MVFDIPSSLIPEWKREVKALCSMYKSSVLGDNYIRVSSHRSSEPPIVTGKKSRSSHYIEFSIRVEGVYTYYYRFTGVEVITEGSIILSGRMLGSLTSNIPGGTTRARFSSNTFKGTFSYELGDLGSISEPLYNRQDIPLVEDSLEYTQLEPSILTHYNTVCGLALDYIQIKVNDNYILQAKYSEAGMCRITYPNDNPIHQHNIYLNIKDIDNVIKDVTGFSTAGNRILLESSDRSLGLWIKDITINSNEAYDRISTLPRVSSSMSRQALINSIEWQSYNLDSIDSLVLSISEETIDDITTTYLLIKGKADTPSRIPITNSEWITTQFLPNSILKALSILSGDSILVEQAVIDVNTITIPVLILSEEIDRYKIEFYIYPQTIRS